MKRGNKRGSKRGAYQKDNGFHPWLREFLGEEISKDLIREAYETAKRKEHLNAEDPDVPKLP